MNFFNWSRLKIVKLNTIELIAAAISSHLNKKNCGKYCEARKKAGQDLCSLFSKFQNMKFKCSGFSLKTKAFVLCSFDLKYVVNLSLHCNKKDINFFQICFGK